MNSPQALLTEVRACTRCAPDLPLGPRPILQLHPSARILIASQAPGRRAHHSGVPFDDASGNRLRRWLNVSREQFYDERLFAILPVGLCYPGQARTGDLPPRPECAPLWRNRLLCALPDVQLTLVIGAYALAFHLPHERGGVTAAVQHWRQDWPHLLPLPHPSPTNNRWFARHPWFEAEVVPALQARVAGLLQAEEN